MKTDYIVVGQGIAGSLMAEALIARGKQVIVVDNNHYQSSSQVAAGLYNPIVFKRFVESWMTEKLLPALNLYYSQLEVKLNATVHHKKNIFKIFASDDELKLWKSKSSTSAYMSEIGTEQLKIEAIENEYGGGLVKDSGFLDLSGLLNLYRDYLKKNNLLVSDFIDNADLNLTQNGVSWKGYEANKIIFCEGSSGMENGFFSWLPFKLTKGELLIIKAPLLESKYVINKGVFILPIGNDMFKVGATYEWQDLSQETTEKGKTELLDKLNKIMKVPYEIVSHLAGVRPTVSDRRPLIGLHPEFKNVAIFNGLGTKGVMIAPYFAEHFAEHLENNLPLNPEVDIKRYLKHYPQA